MVYTHSPHRNSHWVLKLTPQSQYGIRAEIPICPESCFEVDSTESIWYIGDV